MFEVYLLIIKLNMYNGILSNKIVVWVRFIVDDLCVFKHVCNSYELVCKNKIIRLVFNRYYWVVALYNQLH